MGLACLNYHDAKAVFPPGYAATQTYTNGTSDTAPGWGWAAALLSRIEQDNLARQIDFAKPLANFPMILGTFVNTYICPSDVLPSAAFAITDASGTAIVSTAPCGYAACAGGDETGMTDATGRGVFYRNSRTSLKHLLDGTGKTILIGERSWGNANGTWVGAVPNGLCKRGQQNPCPPGGGTSSPSPTLVLAHSHLNNANIDADGGLDDFSSRHTDGANFLFADGHVAFVRSVPADQQDGSYTPDGIAFQALGTRAGGEQVKGLDY
jgi:prepilin-type processing-associated H-X9-DG protein